MKRPLLISTLLTSAALFMTAPVQGQSLTYVDGELVYSPFGVMDDRGVDAIGETLIDPALSALVRTEFERDEIFAAVAAAEDSNRGSKILWTGVKYLGVGVQGVELDVKGTGAGIAAGVFTSITGDAIENYADSMLAELEQQVVAKIIVDLNGRVANLIRPDGQLNRDALKTVSQSDLLQIIQDEKFLGEVGDGREIVQNLLQNVTVAQLEQVLADTEHIKFTVEDTNMRVAALADTVEDVRQLQQQTLATVKSNAAALAGLEESTASTQTIAGRLALNQLPPEQILSLVESRALVLDDDAVTALRNAANAQRIASQFKSTAEVFASAAVLFDALDMDPKVVDAANKFGNAIGAGGAFAAAVALGDPLTVFKTGSAFAGALGAFGGGGDQSAQMSAAILAEIQLLRSEIRKNHQEQMNALKLIYDRIDGIERLLNTQFSGITYDLALLQLDTREILREDISQCKRLFTDFSQPEYRTLVSQGLDGFRGFFESDGRALSFRQCVDGLIERQEVTNEIEFSSLLRADSSELGSAPNEIGDRQTAARNFQQRVLLPTVRFVQAHTKVDTPAAAAQLLFQPSQDLCGALRFQPEQVPLVVCDAKIERTRHVQVLGGSNLNPGGGMVLSPASAVRMARYARTIAPWNGVLVEDPGQAVARVLTNAEVQSLTEAQASQRTRHLHVLNSAVRSLDLVIGQSEAIAATPALALAAQAIDEEVIPAYAQARLSGKPEAINKLLAHRAPEGGTTGPDCGSESSSLAWDTLCLMEANPIAARNIVRMVIARRLKRNGVSWEEWRRALRSPNSSHASRLLGPDVILFDAAKGLQHRSWGAWGLQLPRLYSDPNLGANQTASSCWRPSAVTSLFKQDGKVDEASPFYTGQTSGRCHVLDSVETRNLTALDYGTNINMLVTERELVVGQLRQLCVANELYPATYCAQWR